MGLVPVGLLNVEASLRGIKSHLTVSLRLKGKGGDWYLLGLLNAKAVPCKV